MVMQSMLKQYHRDYVHRVRSDRFSPCVIAVPHRRRTSDPVMRPSIDHEGLCLLCASRVDMLCLLKLFLLCRLDHKPVSQMVSNRLMFMGLTG